MREVDQLIMIIPVILNLKGNLEMNLSARLGTAANIGELDDPPVRRSMIVGNLSLLQVQATVVSFVAACVSLVLGLIVPRTPPPAPPSPNVARDALPSLLHILQSRRPRPALPPSDPTRKSGLPTYVSSNILFTRFCSDAHRFWRVSWIWHSSKFRRICCCGRSFDAQSVPQEHLPSKTSLHTCGSLLFYRPLASPPVFFLPDLSSL